MLMSPQYADRERGAFDYTFSDFENLGKKNRL